MKIKILIALPIAVALIGTAGCGYFSKKEIVSYEYGAEKVKNEQFIVAFSEGGQLESVSSVKIESEMDGSSTIVSIVDEGSTVKGSKRVQAEAGDTPAILAKKYGVAEDALHHVNPDLEQAIKQGESITIPGELYFFGMKGEVAVVAVAPQFKVLARGKFADGFMATPAVIGNTLILRTKSAVYCVE